MQKLPVTLVGSGILFLVVSGLLGWIFIPDIIEGKIKEQVRLVNGTETWEKWQDIPIPVFMSFYAFHVTNPSDISRGAKPKLTQMGPYVYEEKRYKTELYINEQEDKVGYRQPVIYYFRPDKSNGTENDTISILNIPLVAVVSQLSLLVNCPIIPGVCNNLVNRVVNDLFEAGEEVVRQNVRVGDLIFDGMEIKPIYDLLKVIVDLLGIEMPKEFEGGRFGFYKGRNGTDDGKYEVHSGISDAGQFGNILTWNDAPRLSWWGKGGGGAYCNMINGSDGSIFPPFVKKDRILRIFNADLCRSLHLTYDQDIEYKGVKGFRFTPPEDMLEDPAINPDNLCFCANPKKGCPKAWVMQLSVCQSGAPVVASTPHFLDGDSMYVEQSLGISPNRLLHETYVDIEPNTGLVLQAAKRIQINVDLSPTPEISKFSEVAQMMFPIIWAEEYAAVDDENISTLKKQLLLPLSIIKIGKWTGLGIGILLLASGITLAYVQHRT